MRGQVRIAVLPILFSSLLLALAAGGTRSQPARPSAVVYEAFAIRCGVLSDRRVADLVKGADPSRRMDIAAMMWLLKGSNGRVVLVDSGFHQAKFMEQRRVRDFVSPDPAVARAGVTPDAVTEIVLTHMHWDHADGLDLFPNAHVWVQKEEFAYYTGEAWQAKDTHSGIDADNVLQVVQLNTQGRLTLIAGGSQEPIPGIRCYLGGRHTHASQFLVVNAKAGTIVLASDNVALYENLDKHAPITPSLDSSSNPAAQDRMRGFASSLRLIVPGHDPAVFTRFPEIAPGVVRIE